MYRSVAELALVRFCFGAELLMAIWVHVYPNGGHGRSSAKNKAHSVHYRAGGGSERIGLEGRAARAFTAHVLRISSGTCLYWIIACRTTAGGDNRNIVVRIGK